MSGEKASVRSTSLDAPWLSCAAFLMELRLWWHGVRASVDENRLDQGGGSGRHQGRRGLLP